MGTCIPRSRPAVKFAASCIRRAALRMAGGVADRLRQRCANSGSSFRRAWRTRRSSPCSGNGGTTRPRPTALEPRRPRGPWGPRPGSGRGTSNPTELTQDSGMRCRLARLEAAIASGPSHQPRTMAYPPDCSRAAPAVTKMVRRPVGLRRPAAGCGHAACRAWVPFGSVVTGLGQCPNAEAKNGLLPTEYAMGVRAMMRRSMGSRQGIQSART